HWHGIYQNGTNWADGPAMVTQCPIIPGNSFVYDFNVHDQAGTFWYHSHYSTQYCDGLRGPFIIYDPDDPYLNEYDVDDESTIITLSDWIHVASPTPFGSSHSLSTLVNGLGRTLQHEVTLNQLTPLAVVNVTAGKRYRFRIASLACDAPFNFTIHDHSMTIIETDGQYTTPLVVDSLWVYAGQRYSVIVKADQPINNYWIRADPLATRATAGFDNGRNSAIFRYIGAPDEEPTTNGTSTRPLNEDDLHALEKPQPPGKPELGGADIVVPIVQTWHEEAQVFDINGVTYESPTVPVLLQILNGTYAATDLMPNGSVYTLKPNSSVELQIHGVDRGGPHPFHLHGHSFYVIKNALSDEYNWDNPPRRDVIPTGFSGNVTVVRFFTDNSGPWFLHCHIDWHIELGLAIIFAEDPEGTAAHNKPIPPAKRRQNDLVEFQVPRLRSCQGPLSLQQNLAAELREDIDSFAQHVEALQLSIGDQRGEQSRTELRKIVDELQNGLAQLRKDSRAALLSSKRAIDSQSRSRREELMSSSVVSEKVSMNEKVEDALMKANDDVTDALRRTIDLMQGELERSVLSVQMLDESTASLRATSTTHDTLTNFMGTSKQLITALEKSDWIDRILIVSAFVFFLLVVLFIVKQRIVDRSLRLAFWWTRFLPNFSQDEALLGKSSAVLSASTAAFISSALTASATTVAPSFPSPIPIPSEGGDNVEPSITLETLFATLSASTVAPSSSVAEHSSDELYRNADEL
ncbi:hypothetical protein H0H87_007842, partial [Tephrocybe sp. NHM501043]